MAKANLSVSLEVFNAIRNLYSSVNDFITRDREYFDALITDGYFNDIVAAFNMQPVVSAILQDVSDVPVVRHRGRPRKNEASAIIEEIQNNIEFTDSNKEREFNGKKSTKGYIRGKERYHFMDDIRLYNTIYDATCSEDFQNLKNPIIAKVHVSGKDIQRYFPIEERTYKTKNLDVKSTVRNKLKVCLVRKNQWVQSYWPHISTRMCEKTQRTVSNK